MRWWILGVNFVTQEHGDQHEEKLRKIDEEERDETG